MPYLGDCVILSSEPNAGGISAKHVTITSAGLKSLSTSAGGIIYGLLVYATMSTGTAIKNSFLQIFPQTCSGPTVGTTLPALVMPVGLVMTSQAPATTLMAPFWNDFGERGLVSSTGWSAAATITTTGSTLTSDNTYVEIVLSGT